MGGAGEGEGGGNLAMSEKAPTEFGDPDYQFLLDSLVADGDGNWFADEEEERDPTYDPNEEEEEEEEESDDDDDVDSTSRDSGSSSTSSSSGDDFEDDEDDAIPLQEVEELLAETGAMSYLANLPQQHVQAHAPTAAPTRNAQGRLLVPLLPSHPGPRFGLSPGTWQALMHTGVREDERGRLASQMVRHLQLLVQNGAVMAHNLALNQGGEGEGEREEKEAFLDVQAMVKDVHTLRDKAWRYFGFEPGPTGKGAYRERLVSTSTAAATATGDGAGGGGGRDRGGGAGATEGRRRKRNSRNRSSSSSSSCSSKGREIIASPVALPRELKGDQSLLWTYQESRLLLSSSASD